MHRGYLYSGIEEYSLMSDKTSPTGIEPVFLP